MKIPGHIAIASLLLPLLGADLNSQSSGGRAVQARVTSSRSPVRGIRGFNSRPNSWLLTRPSKKPSTSPPPQTEGGTTPVNGKTQRINTRLPKRVFTNGPWLPGQRPQQGTPPTGGQQQQVTTMQMMNSQGGQQRQQSTPPQQMGGAPQQMGGTPQQMGGTPQQMGGAPQQMGPPQQMGGAQGTVQALGNVAQQTGQMQQQGQQNGFPPGAVGLPAPPPNR